MELDRIESLLKLMKEYGVAELGLEEEDSSLHLSMTGSAPPTMPQAPEGARNLRTEEARVQPFCENPLLLH